MAPRSPLTSLANASHLYHPKAQAHIPLHAVITYLPTFILTYLRIVSLSLSARLL